MDRLFYDDEHEAIRAAIEGGKGYKATASYLWPGMKPESAYARLKVCCKDGGDQQLRFGEVIALMKFNDRYSPLAWACDETDHDRPAKRAPKDRAAELMAEFTRSVEQSAKIAAQLERMAPILKAVA